MKETLFEKLCGYDKLDIYPCHMPGHKRQLKTPIENFYQMDITEIDGFDNLHHPTDIIRWEEERAAALYGARKTFFLVNGSTCGNLSAVSACMRKKGTILVARNCHKSVYHAIYLNECKTQYLYPEMIDEYSLVGGITPESVLKALESNSEIQAVMITSPTYDGVISDIAGIADVVHRFGIPLIVDEAHGAHFGLDSSFPKNSIANGADIVIHSLHKTLPSLTQTALLHVQGDIVDYERLARFQSIYQSTSPSYLLLSSISRCLTIMERESHDRMKCFKERLDTFYEKVRDTKELKVVDASVVGQNGVYDFDRAKIIISTAKAEISGDELYEILLSEYRIQMEMAAPEYVQAIMSFMDTEEGFERLATAIIETDRCLVLKKQKKNGTVTQTKTQTKLGSVYSPDLSAESTLTIAAAMDSKWQWKNLSDSEGAVSADFICLYPPGIPLLTPGEKLEKKHLYMLQELRNRKLQLQGVENGQIRVITQYAKER